MSDPQDYPPDFTDVRRRAEKRLQAQQIDPAELSPEEAIRLIHELQVHQIELEIQNEELRQAQSRLEESRNQYSDLYDFAPVGYLTLDGVGKIVGANLTTATLLGWERNSLMEQYFPLFLPNPDRTSFRKLLEGMTADQERRGEFHLKKKNGDGLIMLLDVLLIPDAEGQKNYRVSLSDITELKSVQDELRLHKEDLEKLVTERTGELMAVNEQLREANENLQALFAAAPLAVGVFDAQGKVVNINPAAERIFGWTREESKGRLPFSIPPDAPDESLEVLRKVLGGEPYVGVETKQQRRDGSLIDLSFSAAPLHDAGGNIRGFIGLAEDITERKRAEGALKTQARVLESMAEGVTVTDHHGTITYTNPAFNVMFGYEPGELVGRHSNILNYYPPEENLKIVKDILREVDRAGVWIGEFRNRKKNGLPFLTSSRISALMVGGKRFYISVQEDITARKAAEEALREANERLQTLIQASPAAIISLDNQGKVILWNPAAEQIFGWKAEEVLGRSYQQLMVPKQYRRDFESLLARELAGETTYGMERLRRRKDGSLIYINGSAAPLYDVQGNVKGVVATIQDITQRREMEEALRLAREELEDRVAERTASLRLANEQLLREIQERQEVEDRLRESEARFEAFFEHAITPLVFLDPDFNFIRVNQAYARACQREAGEFVGRNHFDLYPSDAKAIFEEVLHSKVPCQVASRPFEFPDHPEWGVSYWDWSLTPILNEAGEVDFLVYSLKEVTEQVKAEEARNHLVEILENTPDFVGTADYYGNLKYLNRAGKAMVGVREDEEVTHLQVLQLHPPEVKKLILEEGAPTAIREGAWKAESSLLNWEGREIPISQVILAHKDWAGRVQFFSTICRDISDLKEAQENIARQTAILRAINRVLREALACETGEELGRVCLEAAEELTHSRFGFIHEVNDQGKFDALAFSNPGRDLCRVSSVKDLTHLKNINPTGLLAASIRENQAFIANDPASHPEAVGVPRGHTPLTAFLGMPLIFEGRTVGLLGLANKEGGYIPADREAMEILAPTITEALMHHWYKEELKRSERKLRYLADQLLTTQEIHRKRLAAELHDELGHALLSLKLHLRSIEKKLPPEQESIKEEIRVQLADIEDVIHEVRRLYHDLSPGYLEDLGLTKALAALIEDFAANRPRITWKVDLPEFAGLFSPPLETIIYRLVQEALTNIGKHANPFKVTISALKEEQQVRLTVEDDGLGFNVAEALETKGEARGLGLAAMEERLNMVGGSFQVRSRKKEGTRLTFTIPTLPPQRRS